MVTKIEDQLNRIIEGKNPLEASIQQKPIHLGGEKNLARFPNITKAPFVER